MEEGGRVRPQRGGKGRRRGRRSMRRDIGPRQGLMVVRRRRNRLSSRGIGGMRVIRVRSSSRVDSRREGQEGMIGGDELV